MSFTKETKLSALDKSALSFLAKYQGKARAFEIALACGKTKSAHINPTLYGLQIRKFVVTDPPPYWEITQMGRQVLDELQQQQQVQRSNSLNNSSSHQYSTKQHAHTTPLTLSHHLHSDTQFWKSFSLRPYEPLPIHHLSQTQTTAAAAAAAPAASLAPVTTSVPYQSYFAQEDLFTQGNTNRHAPTWKPAQNDSHERLLVEPHLGNERLHGSAFSLPTVSTAVLSEHVPGHSEEHANTISRDVNVCNLCSTPLSVLILIDLNNVSDVLPKLDALDIAGLHVVGFANEQYNGVGVHSCMPLRHSIKTHKCTFNIVRIGQGVSCHLQMIWTMASYLFTSNVETLRKVIISARGNTFQGVQTVLHASHPGLQRVVQAPSWVEVEAQLLMKSE